MRLDCVLIGLFLVTSCGLDRMTLDVSIEFVFFNEDTFGCVQTKSKTFNRGCVRIRSDSVLYF